MNIIQCRHGTRVCNNFLTAYILLELSNITISFLLINKIRSFCSLQMSHSVFSILIIIVYRCRFRLTSALCHSYRLFPFIFVVSRNPNSSRRIILFLCQLICHRPFCAKCSSVLFPCEISLQILIFKMFFQSLPTLPWEHVLYDVTLYKLLQPAAFLQFENLCRIRYTLRTNL